MKVDLTYSEIELIKNALHTTSCVLRDCPDVSDKEIDKHRALRNRFDNYLSHLKNN